MSNPHQVQALLVSSQEAGPDGQKGISQAECAWSHTTWMLKPACPRTSSPSLFLSLAKQGYSWHRSRCARVHVARFPTSHFSLVNWTVCHVCTPALSLRALQGQCAHLQTVWETCNKDGQYLPDFLDLRATFPDQGPALAGRHH